MPKITLYNQRMLDVKKALKLQGTASNQEFYNAIGFDRTNSTKIKNGTNSFTIEQIDIVIKKYGINPAFFFHSKAKMY